MPKGHTVRKVRASQGRIADNVSRRRLPGKCNRNRPPALRRVRMERRGKSSPVSMVTWIRCKPYPKQHRMGIVCPTHIPGWHAAKAAERRGDAPQRQMVVHDRTRLTGKVAQSPPTQRVGGALCFVCCGDQATFLSSPISNSTFLVCGRAKSTAAAIIVKMSSGTIKAPL